MVVRRIVATFVALLTLHLSVIGADFACSQHGAGAAHGQSRSMVHHDAIAAIHVEEVPANQPPCATPTQPECCRAMTSCAVTLAVSGVERSTAVPMLHDAIAPGIMWAPRSLTTAPDPPPPKA